MVDQGLDQAAGLRRMSRLEGLQLISFAATGRDAWIASVARALRRLGAGVVVVDASGGRVAQALGVPAGGELLDLLQGRRRFEAIARSTPDGVYVVRAAKGLEAFAASGLPARRLFAGFAGLPQGFDTVLLVMPPRELACLANPNEAVPIVALEPGRAELAATYALLKQLALEFGYRRLSVVLRGVDAGRAQHAYEQLCATAHQFLNIHITLAGWLPGASGYGPALVELAQGLREGCATPCLLH